MEIYKLIRKMRLDDMSQRQIAAVLHISRNTVRRLVRELREKPQEVFAPLAFPAGDAMQIDGGEATVYLNGIKIVVNLFWARLCYSGAPMVLAYRRKNEESFLDALVRVFRYFGGVLRRVIFDNDKMAVKSPIHEKLRKCMLWYPAMQYS